MKMQFKNLAIRYGVLIVATTSLVSCGNAGQNKEDSSGNKSPAAQEVSKTIEDQTPDISFKDKNGNTVSLNSLKGKVVFINFWATWCPPCIQEMPSINQLKQSFKGNDNIEFLMVDVDSNIEKSTAFMEKNKYDLSVYIPTSKIPPNFLGDAIPTTVILAKNGDMIARIEGGRDYTSPEIVKALNELVESD